MSTVLAWVERESHAVMKWVFIDDIDQYCLVLFDKGRRLPHFKDNVALWATWGYLAYRLQ